MNEAYDEYEVCDKWDRYRTLLWVIYYLDMLSDEEFAQMCAECYRVLDEL